MDKELMIALARQAGLDKALAKFPEDVATAASLATAHRDVVKSPTDPADEPWPPMRAGVGL